MAENIRADHEAMLQYCLELAEKSPPQPTNFRVGAALVRLEHGEVTANGFTLELPGNTHAEECCLQKLSQEHNVTEEKLAEASLSPHAIYTTMEPCSERLSGKLPCVERILRQRNWIKKVYVGVQEPDTFVKANAGRRMLEEAGIEVIHVTGLEEKILSVATAGHVKE